MSDRMERGSARQRILDAAVGLFAHQGYAGTNLDEVAETAGVSKGSIFYHFHSKAELFETLLERAVDVIVADMNDARAGLVGWEAFREMTRQVMIRIDASPDVALIVTTELFRDGRQWSEALRDGRARLLAPMAEVFAQIAAQRQNVPLDACDPADQRDVAAAALGALVVATLDHRQFGADKPLTQVHERLLYALSGLREPDGASS